MRCCKKFDESKRSDGSYHLHGHVTVRRAVVQSGEIMGVEIDEVVHDARRSVVCGQVVGKITRMQTPERTLFSDWGQRAEMGGTLARVVTATKRVEEWIASEFPRT